MRVTIIEMIIALRAVANLHGYKSLAKELEIALLIAIEEKAAT